MARRRSRPPMVPEARQGLDRLKAEVMEQQGYQIDPERPDQVKYMVAKNMGIPLSPSGNGQLTTEAAGKIGGQIGGAMVREMIKRAQQNLMSGKAR